ncbi:hypothetical protein [Algoriphagus boritolerans]
MYNQLGTPEGLKKEQAFPKSGDHVIASAITSDDWQGVLFATIDFLEKVAKVPPKVEYQNQIDELIQAKGVMDGNR